ncbi:MAG: ABC transporter ATP-binding protein [Eubacteriales bacterium]|nr:ABC transporter ATP-binding protein [Eubacteriales bacterium]
MIEIKKVRKSFDGIPAVSDVSLTLQEGNVFGMLGTNGAGKSTLLRMMAGVLKADEGEIFIDGEPVWENPLAKEKIFYISDDQFYFSNATPADIATFYSTFYKDFDARRFSKFLLRFQLEERRKIRTFSKGMKKQLSILLGICANVPYLFCDETFDGLDPVMRQGIKAIFAREMDEKGMTPIIASHNLRELEDICDHIGLLHQGGVLLSKELDELKCNLHKIQCVLPEEVDETLKERLDILNMNRRGKLLTMTVRGDIEKILSKVKAMEPVYCEALPLSLEEIFISETEVVGYDIKNIIF